MIRKIWNKYNVSTILILPIFNKIYDNLYLDKNTKYPFVQLCFEYGLVNTFLYKGNKYDNSIFLKFDKNELTKNNKLTTSQYDSILELIIDNEVYKRLYMNNDYVYIELSIPSEYKNDINIIIESNYSKVSNSYLQCLKLDQKLVPISKNEVGNFISVKNLGYSICSKNNVIKEEIEKELKLKLSEDIEYYEKFNEKKENWQ